MRWLGPTIEDIAGEKLAVVRPGATLVLGDTQPAVESLAARTGARIVRPELVDVDLPGYQRKNFAAAVAAAHAFLGAEPTRDAIRDAVAHSAVPGRLQVVGQRPLTLYDGAHNPPGIAALADSIPEGTVGVISILDDKDAASMLRALLPRLSAAVFTRSPNPRAFPPATLADLAAKVGDVPSEIEPNPRQAVERARALAGPMGTVVATGSIYLVAELLSAPGRRRASAL
jgi:dihydrofolate synthase/folylpolyglutamate synthase